MDLSQLSTLLHILILSATVHTGTYAQFRQPNYLVRGQPDYRSQVFYVPVSQKATKTQSSKAVESDNSNSIIPEKSIYEESTIVPGIARDDTDCQTAENETVGVFYSVAEKTGEAVTGSVSGGGISFSQDHSDWCSDVGRHRFRTFNGACNHPRNLGAALTPLDRLLPPHYDDGLESPRQTGENGHPLPSARLVSSVAHPSGNDVRSFTHMFVQWGQWVDHDMTGIVTASNRQNPIKCCGTDGQFPTVLTNKNCFPIELPATEKHFAGKCMEFVRSLAATNSKGVPLKPREQVNSLNAFIDGSQIYGSTSERAESLRETGDYLLKTKGDFPPEAPGQGCIRRPGSNDYCFLTGDLRTHENPALTALHVIWLREHNKMAKEYAAMRPQTPKEEVFQIVRRNVGALQQHITFNHYLPSILGRDVYRMRLISRLGRSVYNPDVDPRIFNAFSAAAMRFGHSTVPSAYIIGNRVVPLRELFSRPREVLENLDSLLLGLMGVTEKEDRGSQAVDRNFALEITQHLFEPANSTKGKGLDLVSLNIQRGRDHGIPPYTTWRTFCGLRALYGFNDTDALGPYASELGKVYRSVNDIDLFTGIVYEAVDSGLVGPTGRCLLGIQFFKAKFGDRFFFDNDEPLTAFNDDQLYELRNMTLAKVICRNTNIDALPLNVFKFPSPSNPMVPCAQLREEGLDLSLF